MVAKYSRRRAGYEFSDHDSPILRHAWGGQEKLHHDLPRANGRRNNRRSLRLLLSTCASVEFLEPQDYRNRRVPHLSILKGGILRAHAVKRFPKRPRHIEIVP